MFKKYQLRSYNFRLVILLIVTSVYGIAVINSADSSYTIKQCAGLLLSLFVMVVVSLIDYNWLLRFYWIMYALNFVLLVLVLALGSESKGAQRYWRFPFSAFRTDKNTFDYVYGKTDFAV